MFRPRLRGAVLGSLLLAMISVLVATPSQASPPRAYSGVIDGAKFRAEVPANWNGTLVLFNHGYYPTFFVPDFIQLANRAETEQWLLDHGYALAASKFQNEGTGYVVKEAISDQLKLLDWFGTTVGKPRRTIATGQSLGSVTATLLAERYPDRIHGVANVGGDFDPLGLFNVILDLNFAVKTLLTDGKDANGNEIDLVRPRDPQASTDALLAGVETALTTASGRAKLALIASFNNITGWYNAHEPRPTTDEGRIRQQAQWIHDAYVWGLGPLSRVDLESHAGGNPSWNTGVDYGRQLARSSQTGLVHKAYRDTGLRVDADLRKLARAPRIAADPAAVTYLRSWGIPRGTTPSPIITMHTTGDGGAVPDQERWYADQVRRHGDPSKLRQLFVERGAHLSYSAAEEIVMFQSLFQRLDTGHWPTTQPSALNTRAAAFPPDAHKVLDLVTGTDAERPPSFTHFHPARFLRPTP